MDREQLKLKAEQDQAWAEMSEHKDSLYSMIMLATKENFNLELCVSCLKLVATEIFLYENLDNFKENTEKKSSMFMSKQLTMLDDIFSITSKNVSLIEKQKSMESFRNVALDYLKSNREKIIKLSEGPESNGPLNVENIAIIMQCVCWTFLELLLREIELKLLENNLKK